MALKSIVETVDELSGLPEGVKDHYVESDGKWYLSIEGQTQREVELGAKVSEFRDTNVSLMKEKTDLSDKLHEVSSRYNGVDVNVYNEMLEDKKRLTKKDARVVTNEDLTSQIQAAVQASVEPIQAQLDESRKRETSAQAELDKATFRTLVSKTALDAGVRTEAIDDVLNRAVSAGFELHNGSLAVLSDGAVKFSTSRPDQPYTIDEWVQGLQRSGGEHLFKPSISTGHQDSAGPEPRLDSGNLVDPSGRQFARNLENIAKGKVKVTRTANTNPLG